tara:strand:+ start:29 stop:484 length:456 start_codon:yes stop_codon:yes gene_type:complete
MFYLDNKDQFTPVTAQTWIANQFEWEFGSEEEVAQGNTVENQLVPFIKFVLIDPTHPWTTTYHHHDTELHKHAVWHDEVDGDIEGMANYLHRHVGTGGKFDKHTLTDRNGVYHEARVYRTGSYKIIELSWNNCHMASAGSAYFIKVMSMFA